MLTKREAAIISAYTGYLIGEFSEVHKYVEEKFGRPVFTHEMGFNDFQERIRDMAKSDFVLIEVEK